MALRKKKTSKKPAKGSLRVERVAVSKIKPAEYNPRLGLQPGDEEYESIKRSIEKFGCVDSLVWNRRTGNLVAGHQRLRILVDEFDATELDVSVVDLPLADEKALNLALNNISGEWDDVALVSLLAELHADESANPTVTGFTDDDLLALRARLELEEDGGTPPGDGSDAAAVSASFKVVATCVSAKQQKEIMGILNKRGVACHLLTRDG